jgi:hypothetical protein
LLTRRLTLYQPARHNGRLLRVGALEYYGQLREAALPDQDLYDAMVSRYPGWVSRQQFPVPG